jgi:hypothetical protein
MPLGRTFPQKRKQIEVTCKQRNVQHVALTRYHCRLHTQYIRLSRTLVVGVAHFCFVLPSSSFRHERLPPSTAAAEAERGRAMAAAQLFVVVLNSVDELERSAAAPSLPPSCRCRGGW